MKNTKTPGADYIERVRNSFNRQKFMAYLGAELMDVRPGYCKIHLPYRSELSQQHGYFHAGVIGTIADNCGGYAAFSHMEEDSSVLTVEYKLNLLAPGKGELLVGEGHVVKAGRTLTVCRTDIFAVNQGEEKLCATSLMTLIQMKGRPDSSAVNG